MADGEGYEVTGRTRVQRGANRACTDAATIHSILDTSLLCHVAYVDPEGVPVVIPQLFARDEDCILLHGKAGGRLLTAIEEGQKVCITVTHLDGLVCARSIFHHSVNYRSVVVFGRGAVLPEDEKLPALKLLSEHLIANRWADVREPNRSELDSTAVVRVAMEEVSCKIRAEGVGDDAADVKAGVHWAGVVPLRMVSEPPITDKGAAGLAVPAYLNPYQDNGVVSRDERLQQGIETLEPGQKWELLLAILLALTATFFVRVLWHYTMNI